MRQKKAMLITSTVILLAMSLSISVSSHPVRMSSASEVTITPSTWSYLPLISKQLYRVVYFSHNLSGHSVSAECNPGNASSCPCSDADVSIVVLPNYGEVISNPRKIGTYVNAIGHQKFIESLPGGEPIALSVYAYAGQVSLPVVPFPNVDQTENPQAVHIMIQLWDGRNALFQSNKTTREAVIYWDLNPWASDYGKIKVYTNPASLVETGITLTPDTNWHSFEVVADLATQKYVSITIGGETRDLSHLEMARVYQPTWGDEVALIITTESLASWPGTGCPYVFTWATRFRDLEFRLLS